MTLASIPRLLTSIISAKLAQRPRFRLKRPSLTKLVDKEQSIIDRVRRALRAPPSRSVPDRLRLGIGDDAAILHAPARTDWVVSSDAFIEGVHFLVDRHPAESAGYKALARATKDLAAMGATPRFFFLSLAIPSARTGAWLTRLLKGMDRASRKFDIVLAGGDTTELPIVSINITVIGDVKPGTAILRSGARPGDGIYVSGTLGQAQLGLELIRRKLDKIPQSKKLLRPHLYPQPRIGLGRLLASRSLASSMIDLSDGLSTDLARLCAASGVGARLFSGQIPRIAIPAALCARGLHPLQMALNRRGRLRTPFYAAGTTGNETPLRSRSFAGRGQNKKNRRNHYR